MPFLLWICRVEGLGRTGYRGRRARLRPASVPSTRLGILPPTGKPGDDDTCQRLDARRGQRYVGEFGADRDRGRDDVLALRAEAVASVVPERRGIVERVVVVVGVLGCLSGSGLSGVEAVGVSVAGTSESSECCGRVNIEGATGPLDRCSRAWTEDCFQSDRAAVAGYDGGTHTVHIGTYCPYTRIDEKSNGWASWLSP